MTNPATAAIAQVPYVRKAKIARDVRSTQIEVGMVGIEAGVAAPMAIFPFTCWIDSLFGDLNAHGKDAVTFYTGQTVIMSRWH